MREGMKPNVSIFKDGICNGVLFGYDAVAEHETGIVDMCKNFCTHFKPFEEHVAAFRKDKTEPTADEVLKVFDKNLDRIIFRESVKDNAFLFRTTSPYYREEGGKFLDEEFDRLIKNGKSREDQRQRYPGMFHHKPNANYMSKWDKTGFQMFGIGLKEFKRLKDFYGSLTSGKCMIGHSNFPMFRDHTDVGGLALVDKTRLRVEDVEAVVKQGEAYLMRVTLYAKGRQEELMQKVSDTCGGWSYIWPIIQDGKIRYHMNPGHGVKADYLGGYTEAQINRWCEHKCTYQLTSRSPE